jgi:hypothetical protein
VRELFGDRVASLKLTRRRYVEKLSEGSRTPRDYVEFYKETFGPMIAISSSLGHEQRADLDRESSTSRPSGTVGRRKRPNTTTTTCWLSPRPAD